VNGVNFDHNTAFETAWLAILDGDYNFNINFTNNIFNVGWGIIGPGSGVGAQSFYAHSIGGVFLNNVLIGHSDYQYPADTYIVPSIDQVGFTNYKTENFLLVSNSPFKGMATDGTDFGSNLQTSTQAPPVIPTDWTGIVSKNSGKCLGIRDASTAPGASLVQYTCGSGDNQKFKLTPVNGGYAITPKNSGLTVEIGGGPGVTWAGAAVIQWYYWAGSSQIWQVVPTSDGYFNLKPTHDGLCLDVSGSDNSAPTTQASCSGGDSQKWSFSVS
jgi:Ricin-type beta-trefoil lectin domain